MTWTRLHYTCEHEPVDHVVRELVRLTKNHHEAAARELDDHGSTPLHIFCTTGFPTPESLQQLVQYNPAAALQKDRHGETPLHILCRRHHPLTQEQRAVWQVLLQAAPAAAAMANKEGCLPLHVACRHNASNEMLLQDLLQAHPNAIRQRIKLGSPAPRRRPSSLLQHKKIQHIIDPTQGMSHKTESDLHYSLWTQIRDGAYPLHMAVAAKAPLTVVRLLVQAGPPDMLECTDKFGNTPLHIAYATNVEESTIAWLQELAPQAAMTPNKQGRLPWQVAQGRRV